MIKTSCYALLAMGLVTGCAKADQARLFETDINNRTGSDIILTYSDAYPAALQTNRNIPDQETWLSPGNNKAIRQITILRNNNLNLVCNFILTGVVNDYTEGDVDVTLEQNQQHYRVRVHALGDHNPPGDTVVNCQ